MHMVTHVIVTYVPVVRSAHPGLSRAPQTHQSAPALILDHCRLCARLDVHPSPDRRHSVVTEDTTDVKCVPCQRRSSDEHTYDKIL